MLSSLKVKSRQEYLRYPQVVGDFIAEHLTGVSYRLEPVDNPVTATGGIDQDILRLPKYHTLKRVDVEHLDAADEQTSTELWIRIEYEYMDRWRIWRQWTSKATWINFNCNHPAGDDMGQIRYRYTLSTTAGHRVYLEWHIEDRDNVRMTKWPR